MNETITTGSHALNDDDHAEFIRGALDSPMLHIPQHADLTLRIVEEPADLVDPHAWEDTLGVGMTWMVCWSHNGWPYHDLNVICRSATRDEAVRTRDALRAELHRRAELIAG